MEIEAKHLQDCLFSLPEYCAPVWSRSAHVGLVDTQLNSTMWLITGTLKPTRTPWLPVLTNIAPLPLRRKEATDKLISKISDYSHWPVYKDIYEHPDQHPHVTCPFWNDLEPCDLTSQWMSNCPFTKLASLSWWECCEVVDIIWGVIASDNNNTELKHTIIFSNIQQRSQLVFIFIWPLNNCIVCH